MFRTRLQSSALLTLILAGLTVSLTGCGGGGGGGGDNSGTPPPATTGTVVQPNVTVLPSDGSVTVAAQDANSVTLSGKVPALAVGQVIVSGAGAGLLRKVVSASPAGTNTVVQTQQATLEDVFQDADISISKTLGPSDFTTITPMLAGVHIAPAVAGVAKPHDFSKSLTVSFANAKFPQDNPIATLSGTGTITVGFNISASIHHFELQSASFTPQITGALNVQLSRTGSHDFPSLKILLGHLQGEPILTAIGGIPIVFTPDIDIYATLGGTVQAGVTLSSNASVTVGEKVSYAQAGGWSTAPQFDHTFSLTPTLSAYASASFDFTPVRPELNVTIDGIPGPYIAINMPKLNATLAAQTNPLSVDVNVSGDFDGVAGFHAQLFHKDLDYETPPLASHFDIYHQIFTGGTGNSIQNRVLLTVQGDVINGSAIYHKEDASGNIGQQILLQDVHNLASSARSNGLPFQLDVVRSQPTQSIASFVLSGTSSGDYYDTLTITNSAPYSPTQIVGSISYQTSGGEVDGSIIGGRTWGGTYSASFPVTNPDYSQLFYTFIDGLYGDPPPANLEPIYILEENIALALGAIDH